ncbi:MAG: tetratricopeptide repeat protein [bacterium]
MDQGTLFLEKKEYDKALKIFLKDLGKQEDADLKIILLIRISECLFCLGKEEEAKDRLKEALEIAKPLKNFLKWNAVLEGKKLLEKSEKKPK